MAGMYAASGAGSARRHSVRAGELTVPLEPCSTAGGRIVDEKGQPIAGAKVRVCLAGKSPARRGQSPHPLQRITRRGIAITDAAGRWRINDVPKEESVRLQMAVYHPDYISDYYPGELQQHARVNTAMLRQETATLALKRGIVVQGRVTDPAGKPIRGPSWWTVLFLQPQPRLPSVVLTDADGRYRLPAPDRQGKLAGQLHVAARLDRNLPLKAGMPHQDFQMQPASRSACDSSIRRASRFLMCGSAFPSWAKTRGLAARPTAHRRPGKDVPQSRSGHPRPFRRKRGLGGEMEPSRRADLLSGPGREPRADCTLDEDRRRSQRKPQGCVSYLGPSDRRA